MVIHLHERHSLSKVLTNLLVDSVEDIEDPPTMQDSLSVIRGLIASFARIQAEADNWDKKRATELQHCLLAWSEKAGYVFRNEDE